MGGISNMFSGGQQQGYQDYGNQIQNALTQVGQNLQPWQQFGQSAMPGYQQWLQNMQGQQNGQWMNNYQESPYAKYLTNKETNAMNNQAASGGMLGSGANMQDVGNLANNITSQDMQNYFNNMQSQNQMIGGGLNNQLGYGANAANQYSQLAANLLSSLGETQFGQDTSKQQGKNSIIGKLIGSGFTPNGNQNSNIASMFTQNGGQ